MYLDIAFNWMRHVTATNCEQLITDILDCQDPAPAATNAATATLAPMIQYDTFAAAAPVIKYVAPCGTFTCDPSS